MKKLIFILAVPFLIGSCKKQPADSISTRNNPNVIASPYDQPSKAVIVNYSDSSQTTLVFSYNSDGLVKSIETFVDSAAHSEKVSELDFHYQDGKIAGTSRYAFANGEIDNFEGNQMSEYFTYDNGQLKAYYAGVGGVIGTRFTYYYDSLGNVYYILADLGGVLQDSIDASYSINGADRRCYWQNFELGKHPQVGITPQYPSYLATDKEFQYSISGIPDYSSIVWTYSNLPNHFQPEVGNPIIGIDSPIYPTRVQAEKFMTNNLVFEIKGEAMTHNVPLSQFEFTQDANDRLVSIKRIKSNSLPPFIEKAVSIYY
jgi:hypothetical protein